MLLPLKKTDTGEEPEDPRAELVRRLLEYEQMKLAAQKLDALPQLGRDFKSAQAVADISTERMLPDVSVDDLRAAWADILKRAKLNQHHHITREQLSLRDHMTHILRRLHDARFMDLGDLFLERVREGPPLAVVALHF